MVTRLLCVGDIHLGRRPSRIAPSLAGYSLDAAALGPAAAWHRTVAWALTQRVSAVVLAGDVVDRDDDRFEAYGHLERGVKQLTDAGIMVCGVAGNHDVDALPRLADRIPDFHLLGAGGCWQTLDLPARGGEPELRLLGWSFPSIPFRENPLESLEQELDGSTPTIGILHCDLNAGTSPYAPVARADLDATETDAWLLGHIHKPGDLSGFRPIGYLGSLVGLDPGEPGMHGPWLAEVDGRRSVRLTQLPLAPLRWESIEIDAGEFDDFEFEQREDALAGAIVDGFQRLHERLGEAVVDTSAIGCRVRLCGRSKHHRELGLALERSALAEQCRVCDNVVYFVESLHDEAAPVLDLGDLAKSSDPPGLLARRLLALQADGAEGASLIAEAEHSLRAVVERSTAWRVLETGQRSDLDTRSLLLRAGLAALEDMLAQDGHRDAGGGREA